MSNVLIKESLMSNTLDWIPVEKNLESNGVWSKNETGSTVESTRVTGSLVTR